MCASIGIACTAELKEFFFALENLIDWSRLQTDSRQTHTLVMAVSVLSKEDELEQLASIVKSNLTHQHLWTSLSLSKVTLADGSSYTLCTGIPPDQLHPDDVIDKSAKKLPLEWVLPVTTEQKWSIREWAEVFAGIEKVQTGVTRVVMACVTVDGTVVYYFVNKGITKPRKN